METRARAALSQIASEQRGLFSLGQAREVGISEQQLLRATFSGELRHVRRGVFAFQGSPTSQWEEIISASLAAGNNAVVSHQSAASLHRFEHVLPGPVEITQFGPSKLRLSGVVCHRNSDLTFADVVRKGRMLVTSPCRTLLDVAGQLGPALTEKTLDEGLIQRRWSVPEVKGCLSRARNNLPGRGWLERLMLVRTEDPSAESALEAQVYGALRSQPPYKAHFPVVIGGRVYVLDAAWPDRMVGIEIVGRSHRVASRSAFDRERRKLTALSAAGWRIGHLTSTMPAEEISIAVASLLQRSGAGVMPPPTF